MSEDEPEDAGATNSRIPKRGRSEASSGANSTDDIAMKHGLSGDFAKLLAAQKEVQERGLKQELKPIKQAINQQGERLSKVQKDLKELQDWRHKVVADGFSSRDSSAGAALSSMASTLASVAKVPLRARKVCVVGGFECNESDPIVTDIKGQLDAKNIPYEKVVGCGAYCTRAKIHFLDSNAMWHFLTAYKGLKLVSSLAEAGRPIAPGDPDKRCLWHGIDKYEEEIKLSRKVMEARKQIQAFLVAQGKTEEEVKTLVDSNDYGDVILKRMALPDGVLPIKVYEADRGTGLLRVVEGAAAKLTTSGLRFDPNAGLAEINSK